MIGAKANALSDSQKLASMGQLLNEAIKYADAKLWDKAHEKAQKIPNKSADDIITWLKLRSDVQDFQQYEGFLLENSDWPGINYLRIKGEYAISPTISPLRIQEFFSSEPPLTGHGALSLALALLKTGDVGEARKVINKSWLVDSYSKEDFRKILVSFDEILSQLHVQRLDNLLWAGKLSDAKMMLKLVDKDFAKMAEVRIALQSQKAGVDKLLGALPETYKSDPGLVYDRFRFRRSKKYVRYVF